jgi:hypothetical protein
MGCVTTKEIDMRTLSKLLLGAVLLSGAANMAYAQQASSPASADATAQTHAGAQNDRSDGRGDAGDGGQHHRRHGRGGDHMQILDSNGDGFIGADEAAAGADSAFSRLDQNGDRLISESDFTTPHAHQHWWSVSFSGSNDADAAAVLKAKKDQFASLDADKNGTVSHAEFMANAQKRYELADAKKDGKVSPWAFRALE